MVYGIIKEIDNIFLKSDTTLTHRSVQTKYKTHVNIVQMLREVTKQIYIRFGYMWLW